MNAAFDQFQKEIITDEKLRTAKAMLKDTENYPFISDIIKALNIGRTTFYRHFSPKIIQKLRPPL